MSGGGGGGVIRKKIAAALALETVQEQLGPNKRAKAQALLAVEPESWSHNDGDKALKWIKEAYEAFE
jgi:hypothetical protein